ILTLTHRTLQLQRDAPHAVVERVGMDSSRQGQHQRDEDAERSDNAHPGPNTRTSRRHGRAPTAPSGMRAVTRRAATTDAGHSVTRVPSRSSAPPVQIQLTSGLTKMARLIFAVGPSPSQPPSTTYRSSNGVDRKPTRV